MAEEYSSLPSLREANEEGNRQVNLDPTTTVKLKYEWPQSDVDPQDLADQTAELIKSIGPPSDTRHVVEVSSSESGVVVEIKISRIRGGSADLGGELGRALGRGAARGAVKAASRGCLVVFLILNAVGAGLLLGIVKAIELCVGA